MRQDRRQVRLVAPVFGRFASRRGQVRLATRRRVDEDHGGRTARPSGMENFSEMVRSVVSH